MDGVKMMSELKKEYKIKIADLFPEATPTTQGFKIECPDCGLQGGRTEGFILFPDNNQAHCHSSGKWFKMLEAYAMKKKIIRCLDGRDSGDSTSKILHGELFTLTLDEFKNEYGTDKYNDLIVDLNIRQGIELPGNDRLASNFCDELGDVYKTRNVLFFRGETRDVVEIHRYKKVNDEGKEYTENGFKRVDGNRLITLAEMFVKPWTTIYLKSGGKMIVDKSMNQSMATIALTSSNLQNKLPIITRLFDIQIPILYKGKLTFPKKGYDKRFGSWLPYNAPEIKEGKYTLEEAKTIIDKIFEEFCFASEKDRIHAIAGFITPFLRGLFPKFSTRTPVFIYMANRERAGKDYCAGCTGMLYEGCNTEEPAISNDEKGGNLNEEIRKKVMACMIQGKKRFHSANNKGLLNNATFEGVTTAEMWSDRILGRSEIITFNNEMDYSLSGNLGIRLTPDLANRGRVINLHLIDEDANARTFQNPNLHGWILENRCMIISALYTLVKKWYDDGMPNGSLPFTSFPQWARICGGIMESAGYGNPCERDKSAIISLDSDTEEMKQLFEECYAKHPGQWISRDDIVKVVTDEEIMTMDMSDRSNQIKFGLKMDKFTNRILSNIIMKVDSLDQRTSRRKFMFLSVSDNENQLKRTFDGKDVKDNKNQLIRTFDVKDNKNLGNVGEDGNVQLSVHKSLVGINGEWGNLCQPCQPCQNPQLPKSSFNSQTLSDMSEKFNAEMKAEQEIKHERTDRELQFFEAPECMLIVPQCTKEEVFDWVRANPKASYEELDKALGLGCMKHIVDLFNEGLIKPVDDGWEMV